MADSKITALTAISTVDPAADPLVIVDVSDTSMAASGTTKKATINQLLGASGTATLASATITGDLTVRTNKLKVDATGVGIGTTTLFGDLNIQNGSNCRLEVTSQAGGMAIENLNNARNAYLNMTMYADAYIWNRLGSEAMRLNSTGLGVGTSPSFKLDVQSSTATFQLKSTTGTNAAYLFTNNTGGDFYFGKDNSTGATFGSGTGYSAILYSAGAYPMAFFTNAIERMRIDASGNVGIGVTPSAWSLGKALHVNSLDGAVLWGYSGAAVFGNNFRFSGGYLYETTAAASRYSQSSGSHQWFNAPSGTAGNAITFTQAMTLDSTGSLVLGAAAVATTATDGFLYIPGCAGTPTGTPTAKTGRVPLVVDTTNNKLYFYSGGAWVAAN